MERHLEAALAVAHELADAARREVQAHLARGFSVRRKDDGSPVTEVDLAVERAMRAVLARRRPEDAVHGEELGSAEAGATWCWVLDPIDGTRAFAAGLPTFVSLVGLLHEGRPVLGVVDQPATGRRWAAARGGATTCDGRPVRVRPCAAIADAVMGSTAPHLVSATARPRFERLGSAVRDRLWGGDGSLYAALSSGGLDLVAESGLAPHDFAALVPIVEGAGGRMVDWDGAPLAGLGARDVLAVGDGSLLAPALELLAERRG